MVHESQQKALDQVEELEGRVKDGRAAAAIGTAQKEMARALTHLGAATNSAAPLPDALVAEQAAYQALLKLQAREYEVAQQRKGQSGRSQNQRNQQQLDQLDLKQEEDRYETQRQAAAQQTPEQKEQLQVLNRLKELAQRQQDLNEKLKELQNALQEAKTDAEKEELRRQLKRLRDEEREMLADVDELRQQMEKGQNASNTADARQQLDKTRDDVQKASSALEKEEVSQALASGTRAERKFEELRDDFRKKNANQFSESMRQMRTEARDLAEKQKEIGEQMSNRTEPARRTLSNTGEGKELAQKVAGQKAALTNLLSQMSRVSQEAESSEPLLSKQLYDSVRKSSQDNLEKTLSASEQLLAQNFVAEAGKFEQRARADIEDLKKRVEQAAETVLGDETEALRLAKRELDALSDQLDKEMAQATAQKPGAGGAADSASNERSATNRPGSMAAESSGSQAGQTNLASVRGSRFGTGEVTRVASASSKNSTRSPSGDPSSQQKGTGEAESQRQAPSASGGQKDSSAPTQQAQDPGGKQPGQTGQQASQAAQQSGQGEQGEAQQPGQGQQPGHGQPSDGRQAGKGTGTGQATAPTPQNSQENERAAQQPTQQAGDNRGAGRQRNTQPGDSTGEGKFFEREGLNIGRGPLTGPDYTTWSERLGNVEELVEQSDLRQELSRIRDRARVIRADFKRHATEPQWPLVKAQISGPLAEVRQRVAEELARRESKEALVPIDRDPVPSKFSELVRRYYEKLGNPE